MRELLEVVKCPTGVDPKLFDIDALRILNEFIMHGTEWNRPRNFSLSFVALADLLYLAHALHIKDLLKQLDNNLQAISKQSNDTLLQSLIILGSGRLLNTELRSRRRIEKTAAQKLPEIVKHVNFSNIPPTSIANILSSCYLKVHSEMDVVDAALYWLWHQECCLEAVQFAISPIRSAFLTPGDRKTIRRMILSIPRGNQLVSMIMALLHSANNRRCCVVKKHVNKHLIRCCVPIERNDSNVVDFKKLPLCNRVLTKLKHKSADSSSTTESGSNPPKVQLHEVSKCCSETRRNKEQKYVMESVGEKGAEGGAEKARRGPRNPAEPGNVESTSELQSLSEEGEKKKEIHSGVFIKPKKKGKKLSKRRQWLKTWRGRMLGKSKSASRGGSQVSDEDRPYVNPITTLPGSPHCSGK